MTLLAPNKRINAVLIAVGFILIYTNILIILNIPPSNGYELSIYDKYPIYFWYLLICSIIVGQIILVYNSLSEKVGKYFFCGLFIIFYSNAVLLFMPLIRGYSIVGREDILTHIGYMVDIEKTSHIYGNTYPMIHILGVILSFISGINFEKLTMILPALFSLFFIVSYYLVGREIFKEQFALVLTILFCSIPIYGIGNYLLTPNHEANLFFPFIMFLFFKRNASYLGSPEYIFLFLIISFFITFFHPMVSFMLLIFFLVYKFSLHYTAKFVRPEKYTKMNNLILVISITFLSWGRYLYSIVTKTEFFLDTVMAQLFPSLETSNTGMSEFQRYSTSASSVHTSFFSLIKIVLYSYGPYIILDIIALLCIFYILFAFLKEKISRVRSNSLLHTNTITNFSIFGFIFFFIFSLVIMKLMDLFGFIRIHIFSTFFSLILIPSTIILYLQRNNIYKYKLYSKILPILFIGLILLSYFSVFGLYSSPYTRNINQQVPVKNCYGMNFFLNTANNDIPQLEIGVSKFRYSCLFYGVDETSKRNIAYSSNFPIAHFGYSDNSSIKKYYNISCYLLTDDTRFATMQLFPEFKEKWKYTPKDFMKLDNDSDVYEIYTNDGFNIFYID